jgi:uncharacterized protein YcfJ
MIKKLLIGLVIILFAVDAYGHRDVVGQLRQLENAVPSECPLCLCVREKENGMIERTTGKVFGSTEGAVGAVVGGVIGKKVFDHDVGTAVGVIVGNKIGNKMTKEKIKCYEVVEG